MLQTNLFERTFTEKYWVRLIPQESGMALNEATPAGGGQVGPCLTPASELLAA